MPASEVVIEHGLPDSLRDQAVAIFEEAFGEKMRMTVRDQQNRMAFMRRRYVASNVVIARRGEQLLGMAAMSTRGAPYAGGLLGSSWDPRPYRELLGWAGACWAVWGQRLADHRPKADEIYVDGIAVVASERGRGIGTRLLNEVRDIGQAHGKRYVRLDVIDRNPRAQALYARLGYRVTRKQSFRWQERWVGFGAMISMERAVDQAAAPAD